MSPAERARRKGIEGLSRIEKAGTGLVGNYRLQDRPDESQRKTAPTRQPRKAPEAWPVPLTVIADLLYRNTATPYKAARQFGLGNWVAAQVREYLTKGAWFCQELDLERAIRFNAAYLKRRADFVLARRDRHTDRALDGGVLARELGVDTRSCGTGFYAVWIAFIDGVAEELVFAIQNGHVEDVLWADAEQYLDNQVAPRPRALARFHATPEQPPQTEPSDVPLNLIGGIARLNRVMDGVASPDPDVRDAMLNSWDLHRLRHCDLPETDWDGEFADL